MEEHLVEPHPLPCRGVSTQPGGALMGAQHVSRPHSHSTPSWAHLASTTAALVRAEERPPGDVDAFLEGAVVRQPLGGERLNKLGRQGTAQRPAGNNGVSPLCWAGTEQ